MKTMKYNRIPRGAAPPDAEFDKNTIDGATGYGRRSVALCGPLVWNGEKHLPLFRREKDETGWAGYYKLMPTVQSVED